MPIYFMNNLSSVKISSFQFTSSRRLASENFLLKIMVYFTWTEWGKRTINSGLESKPEFNHLYPWVYLLSVSRVLAQLRYLNCLSTLIINLSRMQEAKLPKHGTGVQSYKPTSFQIILRAL